MFTALICIKQANSEVQSALISINAEPQERPHFTDELWMSENKEVEDANQINATRIVG
jgi:TPP-dependent trihydroxycyclohexane-1,2-dione (THcHDO) dehydratase